MDYNTKIYIRKDNFGVFIIDIYQHQENNSISYVRLSFDNIADINMKLNQNS